MSSVEKALVGFFKTNNVCELFEALGVKINAPHDTVVHTKFGMVTLKPDFLYTLPATDYAQAVVSLEALGFITRHLDEVTDSCMVSWYDPTKDIDFELIFDVSRSDVTGNVDVISRQKLVQLSIDHLVSPNNSAGFKILKVDNIENGMLLSVDIKGVKASLQLAITEATPGIDDGYTRLEWEEVNPMGAKAVMELNKVKPFWFGVMRAVTASRILAEIEISADKAS